MPSKALAHTIHQPVWLTMYLESWPNEYFTDIRQGIPLITGRFDPLEQLDEFSRSF